MRRTMAPAPPPPARAAGANATVIGFTPRALGARAAATHRAATSRATRRIATDPATDRADAAEATAASNGRHQSSGKLNGETE